MLLQQGMRTSMSQVMIDIANATAPRGVQWTIFFDELGYLNFKETELDGKPAVTLVDERDILKISPEYTSRNIQNVVRAQATCESQQPITVIAYDIDSITAFTEYPVYDLSTDILTAVLGMDPGSAVAFMSGLCNSHLFQLCLSVDIQTECRYSLQSFFASWGCCSYSREKEWN